MAAVIVGLTTPAFAQTQTPDEQKQAASEGSGLAGLVLTAAGVAAGVLIADYAVGGNLAARIVGIAPAAPRGYVISQAAFTEARQAGAIVGERIAPAIAVGDSRATTGLLTGLAIIGSGILGGLAVANLTN